MATAEPRITQVGGPELLLSSPAEINVSVMIPIVFWASLVPCASETNDAETIWPVRNPRVASGFRPG